MKRNVRRYIAIILAISVMALGLAPGCATLPTQRTTVKHYAKCYEPIQHLRDSQENFIKSIVIGAAIGAVAGGILTGIMTGNAKSALIGAGAGLVTGAIAGYFKARYDQQKDDRARLATYSVDIRKNIAGLQRVEQYATVASQCYLDKFHQLLADVKAGTISKAEARERMKEIQDGSSEIEEILVDVEKTAKKRQQEFEVALQNENKIAKQKGTTAELNKTIDVGSPTLQLGSEGTAVQEVQRKLQALAIYQGPINGQFNGALKQAVITFQKDNKLEADGTVGPGTWKVLRFKVPDGTLSKVAEDNELYGAAVQSSSAKFNVIRNSLKPVREYNADAMATAPSLRSGV